MWSRKVLRERGDVGVDHLTEVISQPYVKIRLDMTSADGSWVVRVSTTKENLDRQLDALSVTRMAAERIYVDKKSGAPTDRPVLRARCRTLPAPAMWFVVHALDRLERTVRDIHSRRLGPSCPSGGRRSPVAAAPRRFGLSVAGSG